MDMTREAPPRPAKHSYILGLSVFLVLLCAGTDAEASPARDKAGTSPIRDGFTLGATMGRGSIDIRCATCSDAKITEALSATGHLGYMVSPRLAIVGEYWLVRFKDRGSELFDDSEVHLVSQHMSTLAAQVYVTERLWIKGGFGFGWHVSDGDYDAPPPAPSGMPTNTHGTTTTTPEAAPRDAAQGTTRFVAMGLEVAHNHSFAADIQLRAGKTSFPERNYEVYNTGLNLGFHWY